jgi:hypothetical protein
VLSHARSLSRIGKLLMMKAADGSESVEGSWALVILLFAK